MIKYRAWPSIPEITPVEILRETEKMVVIAVPDRYYYKTGERRELKKTEDYAYFNTWQEAHSALAKYAELDLDKIRGRLCDAEKKYARIKEMQVGTP